MFMAKLLFVNYILSNFAARIAKENIMARLIKSYKEDIGASPDDISFHGEKKEDFIRLRIINYNPDKLLEKTVKDVDEAVSYINNESVTWFNVDGLHDDNIMRDISTKFAIDSFIIADILNVDSRPKIHEYDDCIYMSVKMLNCDDTQTVTSENLVLIIKNNVLLSFQERKGDVFEPVRDRLRNNRKRFRHSGTDYLAFALLDVIVDNYIFIITCLGNNIEHLDEVMTESLKQTTMEEIKKYKSELTYLRKIIKPCRELIMNFAKMDSELIHDYMKPHVKTLQSNIELANETIDNYREMLADLLNVFNNMATNKVNDILKVLTIFSVIFIPLTFITGIYGTNFANIPGLNWKYGYYVMLGIIALIAVVMIFYFKKKKWF